MGIARDRGRPPSLRAIRGLLLVVSFLAWASAAEARQKTHEDESRVPAYTLPDPLVLADGSRVADSSMWTGKRRAEILSLFETHMYGKSPGRPPGLRFQVVRVVPDALRGKATRKEIAISFSDAPDGPRVDVLVYVPNRFRGPHPAILGLNFDGNHAVDPDPALPLARGWVANDPALGITNHRATEASRGSESSRWPLERIVDRGYAVVTAHYGDIDPDFDDGFKNGVHALERKSGDSPREADAWGSIAAWSWGLGRIMDYLETDPAIDSRRVTVHGHSRLGKAALWAGATDERFAAVISNESGEGGAALSRRRFGETVHRINTSFPHWFCANYQRYNDREDDLPFDQHMLLSLIAPRPLLVCSAQEDLWADPRGEFLAAIGADPVYRLLGQDGMGARDMPGPNVLIWSRIGYHIRPGKHDVTLADWDAFMDFVGRHLVPPERLP